MAQRYPTGVPEHPRDTFLKLGTSKATVPVGGSFGGKRREKHALEFLSVPPPWSPLRPSCKLAIVPGDGIEELCPQCGQEKKLCDINRKQEF